jgi:hypothetical protein
MFASAPVNADEAYRNHYHRAPNHLASLALFVDLAEARPLAQLLVGVDAQHRDVVLGA